jgi:ATP-dependent exoDNAse (exonuclease V) beta subunit
MVILNSLHRDSLEDGDFMKKDFSKITVKTTPDGQVCFNLFPPVDVVNKLVAARVQSAEKANELWEFLKEKKRAEDLRLLYVGFTRAENYLISLSFGAVPSKWLENTRVTFSSNVSQEPICDDSTLVASLSQTVSVLPYDNVVTKVEGKKKYISPSQCEADPQAEVPTCELEKIADNIDVARWNIDADVFGTCIHNYMAVHRWASDKKYAETNIKNAGRVLAGFGLEGLLSADALVAQADAFFAYVEKKYGKVKIVEHEMPFTQRKDGQVITGEIDLYVKTEFGTGILVDFKNPMTRRDVTDQDLKDKAIKYWPQLEKYRSALCLSGSPVDQVFIYYPLLGIVAKF